MSASVNSNLAKWKTKQNQKKKRYHWAEKSILGWHCGTVG